MSRIGGLHQLRQLARLTGATGTTDPSSDPAGAPGDGAAVAAPSAATVASGGDGATGPAVAAPGPSNDGSGGDGNTAAPPTPVSKSSRAAFLSARWPDILRYFQFVPVGHRDADRAGMAAPPPGPRPIPSRPPVRPSGYPRGPRALDASAAPTFAQTRPPALTDTSAILAGTPIVHSDPSRDDEEPIFDENAQLVPLRRLEAAVHLPPRHPRPAHPHRRVALPRTILL